MMEKFTLSILYDSYSQHILLKLLLKSIRVKINVKKHENTRVKASFDFLLNTICIVIVLSSYSVSDVIQIK